MANTPLLLAGLGALIAAGTVYVWRQKAGWDFTNPDQETVS